MSKLKDLEWLFNGRHFDREVIVPCVRWYHRYKLSLRDLVEMMAALPVSRPHYDPALGETLHAGVRRTLEQARDDSRSVVPRRLRANSPLRDSRIVSPVAQS